MFKERGYPEKITTLAGPTNAIFAIVIDRLEEDVNSSMISSLAAYRPPVI